MLLLLSCIKCIKICHLKKLILTAIILFQNWRPEHDIINNLKMLLNIDIFPKKEIEESTEDYNAVVTDEECCICFSLDLDNNLPDKICNNEKCRRHFHTSCLLQVYLYTYYITCKYSSIR